MNTLFLHLAALAALCTCGVHLFIGGTVAVGPLFQGKPLPAASKWLNYLCWHIASITLAALALGYEWIALTGTGQELAWFLTLLAASLSALSTAVAVKGRFSPLRLPSTYLLALIASLGALALTI